MEDELLPFIHIQEPIGNNSFQNVAPLLNYMPFFSPSPTGGPEGGPCGGGQHPFLRNDGCHRYSSQREHCPGACPDTPKIIVHHVSPEKSFGKILSAVYLSMDVCYRKKKI